MNITEVEEGLRYLRFVAFLDSLQTGAQKLAMYRIPGMQVLGGLMDGL